MAGRVGSPLALLASRGAPPVGVPRSAMPSRRWPGVRLARPVLGCHADCARHAYLDSISALGPVTASIRRPGRTAAVSAFARPPRTVVGAFARHGPPVSGAIGGHNRIADGCDGILDRLADCMVRPQPPLPCGYGSGKQQLSVADRENPPVGEAAAAWGARTASSRPRLASAASLGMLGGMGDRRTFDLPVADTVASGPADTHDTAVARSSRRHGGAAAGIVN